MAVKLLMFNLTHKKKNTDWSHTKILLLACQMGENSRVRSHVSEVKVQENRTGKQRPVRSGQSYRGNHLPRRAALLCLNGHSTEPASRPACSHGLRGGHAHHPWGPRPEPLAYKHCETQKTNSRFMPQMCSYLLWSQNILFIKLWKETWTKQVFIYRPLWQNRRHEGLDSGWENLFTVWFYMFGCLNRGGVLFFQNEQKCELKTTKLLF